MRVPLKLDEVVCPSPGGAAAPPASRFPCLRFSDIIFKLRPLVRLRPPYVRGSCCDPLIYILHVATPLYKGVSPGPGGAAAPPAFCLPCVRVSGFGIRFRVSDFGFRDSGFRVSVLGVRVDD